MAKSTNSGVREELYSRRTEFFQRFNENTLVMDQVPKNFVYMGPGPVQNTFYEELIGLGFNPSKDEMEAVISVKRRTGYFGEGEIGTREYVRFYLDFRDGQGFIDQGCISVNVVNQRKIEKVQETAPICFSVSLRKSSERPFFCNNPIVPRMRVILSWLIEPPADSPNWRPTWGNVEECHMQPGPRKKWKNNLNGRRSSDATGGIMLPTIGGVSTIELQRSLGAERVPQPVSWKSREMMQVALSSRKMKVPASRFAYWTVRKIMTDPHSRTAQISHSILKRFNVDVEELKLELGAVESSQVHATNTEFEELESVGFSPEKGCLTAILKVKKGVGFNGNLCTSGSREYVAFWVDWGADGGWSYLGTSETHVHNLGEDSGAVCYAVPLALNERDLDRLNRCRMPVKVRGVLSWSVRPSIDNPNQLEYYGNRLETYITKL